ncbi:MAG: M1 family metallopeptidase [Polyangiaceae bacterium]
MGERLARRFFALSCAVGLVFLFASCAELPRAPLVAAPAGPSAPVGAAPTPPLTAHADEVVDYTLTAKLDPNAHTVAGNGTLKWTNTSVVPVTELWFHLYLNAFKNQRSVYIREPLGPGRGASPVTDWGTIDVRRLFWREERAELWTKAETHRPGDDDETDARVPLPRAVKPGETITLEMTWDDKLPSIVERTGFYGRFHFVGQWFPKIARLEADGTWAHFPFHRLSEFYADFGRYDVTLDVPATYVVGATGPKTEERVEGDRRIERHVQTDVHDFAWTAWDGFRVFDETVGGVAVRLLYPAGYEKVAARELDTIRFALPHFNERYGAYPYGVLTVVHPPEGAGEAGGMEYPTLITTGGAWWVPAAARSVEAVTIHELGHEWFYGLLASNENASPFLDEGLNTFAEHEGMRAWRGDGSVWDGFGLTIDGRAIDATFADRAALVQPVGNAAPKFDSFELYGRLVYLRTGAILETLRGVYGSDAFDRAFGGYTRAYRFKHPTRENFFQSMEQGLGKDAGTNLRRAIEEKGWVDYRVLGVASHSASAAAGIFDRDGKRETVSARPVSGAGETSYDGWVLLAREGTLAFPVDVDVLFTDGTTQRMAWDAREETTRLAVKSAAPIRSVIIDPERRVLLDRDPRNNYARAAGASSYAGWAILERASYVAAGLLEVLLP